MSDAERAKISAGMRARWSQRKEDGAAAKVEVPVQTVTIVSSSAVEGADNADGEVASQVIALISAIGKQADLAIDTEGLPATLMVADNQQLQQLGCAAVSWFKQSRWVLAQIFTEVSRRSESNRKGGRPAAGAITLSGFCATVNFPRKSAQTLLKNLALVKQAHPQLLEAAARRGIDVLKPKVVAELDRIKEDMWGMSECATVQLEEYICRLAAAEDRAANAAPVGGITRQAEPSSDPRPKSSRKRPGPGPKCYAFKGHELEKLDNALVVIRRIPGFAAEDMAEEELMLLAVESFAKVLEAEHANANSGV